MSEKLVVKEITEEEFRNPTPQVEEPNEQQETANESTTPLAEPQKDNETTQEVSADKVELPLSEDGKVVFTPEMENEISDKIKEANPDISEDELKGAIDEQKALINEQYGRPVEKTDAKAEPEAKVKPSQEDIEKSLNTLISERTQGQYDNIDKIIEENKALKEKAEYNYVHPSVKKLNDLLATKGAVDDNTIFNFLKVQNTDYTKLSTSELIAEAIRLDEPEISTPEIQLKLEKFDILNKSKEDIDEMIEDGELTRVKYDAIKNEYERMGRHSLKKLEDNKKSLETSLSLTEEEMQVNQKKSEEDTKKIIEEFNNKVSKKLPTFTINKVQVSKDKDGNPTYLDYKVTEEERKQVEATAKNINSFFARYVDKETGDVDFNHLFSDLHWLENKESIIAAATAKTANDTKKSTIARINNYSFLEKTGNTSASRRLSEREQLAEQYNQKVMGG